LAGSFRAEQNNYNQTKTVSQSRRATTARINHD
jgi:hypothetical protein